MGDKEDTKEWVEELFDYGAKVAGANVENIADHLSVVGENFRFDPDELLEAAKGQEFTKVVILGQHPDGSLWLSGSANAGESIILMELAKHQLIHSG